MSRKRSYGDACGVARALDTVGERWSLIVVRELLLGPKRFTDLRAGLPNVGPDVLTQRLKDLTAAGLVHRHTLPPPAASTVYELTPAGAALAPVLHELGAWGAQFAPPPAEGMCLSTDSNLLSIRTLFDPERAAGQAGRFSIRLDEGDYHAVVAGGEIAVGRGLLADADATIAGPALDLLDVVHGRQALGASGLRLEGDVALAESFLGWAPLPA